MFAKIGENGFVRISVFFQEFCSKISRNPMKFGLDQNRFLFFMAFLFLLPGCASSQKRNKQNKTKQPEIIQQPEVIPVPKPSADELFFLQLASRYPRTIQNILDQKAENEVQVIYTEINRDKNNKATLFPHYYNISNNNISAGGIAALPVAMYSLQKMAELQSSGITAYSTMITESGGSSLPATFNDPNTADGKPTLTQYLKRLLLADDKEAFDRLYEFTGTDYINNALKKQGFITDTIAARRSDSFNTRQNLTTNPVLFYTNEMKLQYRQPLQVSRWIVSNKEIKTGNQLSLPDAQVMLQSLFFPQSVAASKRFQLTEADQVFMKAYLGLLPRQSVFPFYGITVPDATSKFLYYGAAQGNKDTRFKIYNVSSMEDGRITDVAYFADLDRKVEFMLSATSKIKLDENGEPMANDPVIGFFRDLGLAIYNYETARKRNYLPEFSDLPLATD